MNRTQLYIKIRGQWKELDLTDDVSIPLTYSIYDVKDPSKVKSSYSKTISIPDTNNNRDILEGLYDVNNEITSNINNRMDCYLLQDTIMIFEGKIRFDKIDTNNNKKFLYQATLIGSNSNLFKSIGESYMTDLDLTPLNHTFSTDNIMATWTSSNDIGYYYGMIDYNADFEIVDESRLYRPQVYIKKLIDGIIFNAGYTYESNFFNNNETYNNLLLPYMDTKNTKLFSVDKNLLDRVFVGLTSSGQTYSFNLSIGVTDNDVNSTNPLFNRKRIEFTNENNPYGDFSNKWDVNTYEYTGDRFDKTIQFGMNIDISVIEQGLALEFDDWGIEVEFRRSINPKTNVVDTTEGWPIPTLKPRGGGLPEDPFVLLSKNTTGFYNNITPNFTSNNIVDTNGAIVTYRGVLESALLDNTQHPDNLYKPILNNEKVWATIRLKWFRFNSTPTGTFSYITLNATPTVGEVGTFIISNETPSITFTNGIEVNMNNLLPEKIKQKDFLSSIIKMFNLYIDVDKMNPKKLIIEPRDNYYTNEVLDWTNKLDISTAIEQQLLIDKNNKYLFTHKNDEKERLLKNYTEKLGDVYGEYELNIDGEYKTDTTEISTIFTPMVLQNVGIFKGFNYKSLVISKMVKEDSKPDDYRKYIGGPRIVQRNPRGFVYLQGGEKYEFGTYSLDYYPYVGHYDDPLNATTDINFGLNKSLYYEANSATNNNLYNRYWRNLIDELIDPDTRIINATFYLTPSDINEFSFRKYIRVRQLASSTDTIFKVNKINYDPSNRKAKVELLKSKQYKYNDNKRDFGQPFGRPNIIDGVTTVGGGVITNGPNGVLGNGLALINGSNNILNPNFNSVFISGNDNYVGSSARNSNIIGSTGSILLGEVDNSNIIGGSNNEIGLRVQNSFILGGSNNKIETGVTNSFIFGGDGVTLTESNVSYFEQKLIVKSIEDLSGNPIGGLEIPFTKTGSNTLFGVDNNNVYFDSDNFYLTSSNIFLNGTVSFGNEIVSGDTSGGGVIINPNSTTASISIKSDNNVITFGDEAPNYVGSTGESNMLFGKGGQFDLTTGVENTVFGYNSGNNMTTDSRNVFMGSNIAINTSNASDNVGIGYNSLNSLAGGDWNVGVGSRTLENITAGEANIAIGGRTGFNITGGDRNILIGYEAGFSMISSTENVIIGDNSSTGISTGSKNTILGSENAGGLNPITTGDRNVIVGSNITRASGSPQPSDSLSFGTDVLIQESGSINLGSAVHPYNTSATFSGVTASYLEVYVNGTKYKIPLYT